MTEQGAGTHLPASLGSDDAIFDPPQYPDARLLTVSISIASSEFDSDVRVHSERKRGGLGDRESDS